MTKQELRKNMKAKRLELSDDERRLYDMLIFDRAHKARSFQLAKDVHIFMNTPDEPYTMPFIEYGLAIGKNVFVPVVDQRTGTMIHCGITNATRWTKGMFGIPEPVDRDNVVPDSYFDDSSACIVPVLAFNESCHRLGYGKGYYDKFLSKCTSYAIGIGYDFQYSKEFVAEPHDVALFAIATEQRWYSPQV